MQSRLDAILRILGLNVSADGVTKRSDIRQWQNWIIYGCLQYVNHLYPTANHMRVATIVVYRDQQRVVSEWCGDCMFKRVCRVNGNWRESDEIGSSRRYTLILLHSHQSRRPYLQNQRAFERCLEVYWHFKDFTYCHFRKCLNRRGSETGDFKELSRMNK